MVPTGAAGSIAAVLHGSKERRKMMQDNANFNNAVLFKTIQPFTQHHVPFFCCPLATENDEFGKIV